MYILKHCPYRLRLNRIVRDIPSTYIVAGERRGNLRQLLESELRRRSIRCRDIRERECKGAPLTVAEAHVFVDEFRASNGTEFYISTENRERTCLYGHLRLRIRDDASEANSLYPSLAHCALIRELHTYGKLVAVDHANTGAEAQHVGVGTRLMRIAEGICVERFGLTKVAVISGVGARKYYEKLGYRLENTYMVKVLLAAPASEVSPNGADDGSDASDGGILGSAMRSIRGFFGN